MKRIMVSALAFIQNYVWSYKNYSYWCEKKSILRALWLKTKFCSLNESVVFGRISNLMGAEYITVGENSGFGDGLTLTAWSEFRNQRFNPSITIGKNCWIGLYNHISSTNRIEIGDGFLSGKWVTIVDNDHGYTDYDSLQVPPAKRSIVSKGPVIIGKNVWVGDKATILAGVTIGDGAVIAANTVVTKDVPAYSVCAGNPGKIIKQNIDK